MGGIGACRCVWNFCGRSVRWDIILWGVWWSIGRGFGWGWGWNGWEVGCSGLGWVSLNRDIFLRVVGPWQRWGCFRRTSDRTKVWECCRCKFEFYSKKCLWFWQFSFHTITIWGWCSCHWDNPTDTLFHWAFPWQIGQCSIQAVVSSALTS